jgi:hypothetical protein
MARHKNTDWNLPEGRQAAEKGVTIHGWPAIHSALLMDIRDELQRLNSLLACRNFQQIPATLRAIQRNTTKRRRKRP